MFHQQCENSIKRNSCNFYAISAVYNFLKTWSYRSIVMRLLIGGNAKLGLIR